MKRIQIRKIVTPGKTESREDFIKRCMGAEAAAFPDADQRFAVCNAKFKAKKVDGFFDYLLKQAKMKTEGGVRFPAAAFAYTPDKEKPSTWKLRLWETPQKKETKAQVGRAVAALGKGFRGNKVQIPRADLPGVKKKVATAFRKVNPGEDLPEVLT